MDSLEEGIDMVKKLNQDLGRLEAIHTVLKLAVKYKAQLPQAFCDELCNIRDSFAKT